LLSFADLRHFKKFKAEFGGLEALKAERLGALEDENS
jgi:hypothetical protein